MKQASLDLLLLALFLGGVQGLLLSLVLFFYPKGNRRANASLAASILVFSAVILLHAAGHVFPALPGGHASDLSLTLFLLVGPFLLSYVHAMTAPGLPSRKRFLPHVLPFPLVLAAGLALSRYGEVRFHEAVGIFRFVLPFHLAAYLVFSGRELSAHAKRLADVCSSTEKKSLGWLRLLLAGFLIVMTAAFALGTLRLVPRPWDWGLLFFGVFIYLVSYLALFQPEVVFPEKRPEGRKYERSALAAAEIEAYGKRIEEAFARDRLHLRGGLTLPELAGHLASPVHHLSQAINEGLGMSFYDLVNGYRVEEARRLLEGPDGGTLKLAAIGYEAGFSSVSAFNASFRRLTGLTPSRYRKKVLAGGLPPRG